MNSIWIPEMLYRAWPLLTILMAIGYGVIGCHLMAFVLTIYATYICWQRFGFGWLEEWQQ